MNYLTFRLIIVFLASIVGISTYTVSGFANSQASSQDQPKWERYSASGEEFSVLLPEQPAISLMFRQENFLRRLKPGHLYAAYRDGTVYLVIAFDNSRNDSLDSFIDEFKTYQVFNAGMSFDRNITANGFKGKQYLIKTDNVNGTVQFYKTKSHVYIFEAVSHDLDTVSIKQFLSSLTLDGKTKGKDVAEGFMSAYFRTAPISPVLPPNTGENQNPSQIKIFNPREVTHKAVIVTKPQAQYTEQAREKNAGGTVVLRAVLSTTGRVTNVRAVSGLPYGLTEKAIIAAYLIKFIPAIKDEKFVPQYIQIEYNFNLY